MALVITIAQQKGGSGKTTLAANLAACFAATRRVALLDIDPQHSLARWHALRRAGPAIALSEVAGWRLGGELDRLMREAEVVVVDTPPAIDNDARRAIRVAGLVLVPVQASAPDLWAAEGTVALAKAERRPFALVVNRAPTTPKLRDKAAATVAASGHAVLGASLGNRAGFAQAFAKGMSATEMDPRSTAASEMRAVFAAVVALVG